jgi:hypothetical protein
MEQTDAHLLKTSNKVYEEQKLKNTSKFGGEREAVPESYLVTGPVTL